MSPEEVVRAVLGAWARLDVEEILTLFAPDAVYENVGIGTASGTDEIRNAIEPMISSLSFFDSEIVNLAVSGSVVFTERIDHIVMDGMPIPFRVMGIWEVKGDQVLAKRDYFNAARQT